MTMATARWVASPGSSDARWRAPSAARAPHTGWMETTASG